MTLENPLYMQELSYSARQDRSVIDRLFTEGVLSSTELKVTQRAAGANMSVDVAAGTCVIDGDDQVNQGSYFCRSTGVENVAITTADPTNPRIDLVVAEIRDNNVTAGGSNDWRIYVIAGTPAGSPTVPAVPNSAIPLAQVAVAAAAASIVTANITDRRNTGYVPVVPVVRQGAVPTISSHSAKMKRDGTQIHYKGWAIVSSGGTAGQAIQVDLPVPGVATLPTVSREAIGVGVVEGGGFMYACVAAMVTTGLRLAFYHPTTTTGANVGTTPAHTLANGHLVTWDVLFEAV